ncbi:MAG: hypothetical protein V1775_17895 [Bacteroidota bacterium]
MTRAALLLSRIHILRLLRMINQLGIFRIAFLLVIIIYVIKATLKPGMLSYQALLLVSVTLQAHFKRKDFVLLNNLGLNKPGYFILLYLLLLSPFLLLYLFWPDFIAALILISGIILISFRLTPLRNILKIHNPSFRFIPADSWEWRVGLRQYFPVFLIAYILPAILFQHDYLFAASLLLMAITTNSFQGHHEPLNMNGAIMRTPVSYYRRKVFLQCISFSILATPLLIASFFLYPEGFTPVLLIFTNSLIVQVFAVSLKYAGYMPGLQSPYYMGINILLNFAFIFPALLPIPLVLAAVFSRKAVTQLKLVTG